MVEAPIIILLTQDRWSAHSSMSQTSMQTEAFTENGYERWTHTHTHTHRLEAQFIKKVRQHWGWAEDKALFIKETCSSCFAYVHFQSQLTAKYFLLGKSETWGKFLSTRLLRKCNKKSLIKITASQNCSNGLVWRRPCISYTPALQPHQIVSLRR